MTTDELGTQLRAWRDRLDPAGAGLPARTRRRTTGLRREEVAALSGVSTDYVTRLEQGRARNPSAQVVQALARALRLDDEERDRLYRMAGHLPPTSGRMVRQLTPSVLRIVAASCGPMPFTVEMASTSAFLSRLAAYNPPKPPPTITTRGLPFEMWMLIRQTSLSRSWAGIVGPHLSLAT